MSEDQVIVWESREVGVLLALVGGFLESYTYLNTGAFLRMHKQEIWYY